MGNTSQCIHSVETSTNKPKCDMSIIKKKPLMDIITEKDKTTIRTSWNKLKKTTDLKQLGIDMMVL